jgi:hypothetical protein
MNITALWTLARHVWAEAERVHGTLLGVTIDQAGLQADMDRIYEWRVWWEKQA